MHTEKILMKLSMWLFDERDELLNNLLKRGFDSEPAYNGKHVKTEIEYYEGLINTNFHGGKVPQEGYQCICLSVILIDSVFATGKKFDPQVFVEEYKQIVNEKKKERCINILSMNILNILNVRSQTLHYAGY